MPTPENTLPIEEAFLEAQKVVLANLKLMLEMYQTVRYDVIVEIEPHWRQASQSKEVGNYREALNQHVKVGAEEYRKLMSNSLQKIDMKAIETLSDRIEKLEQASADSWLDSGQTS